MIFSLANKFSDAHSPSIVKLIYVKGQEETLCYVDALGTIKVLDFSKTPLKPVVIYQSKTGKQRASVTALASHPNGHLFVGDSEGKLTIFKLSSKANNSHTTKIHGSRVNCLEFSSDGRRLITASNDKTIKVYQILPAEPRGLEAPQFELSVAAHTLFVLKARIDPSLEYIASLDEKTFLLTNAKTKKQKVRFGAVDAPFLDFSFSNAEGAWIAAAHGVLLKIAFADGSIQRIFSTCGLLPDRLVFAQESHKVLFIASASEATAGSKVVVLDLHTTSVDFEVTLNSERILDLDFQDQGSLFTFASQSGIFLWKSAPVITPAAISVSKRLSTSGLTTSNSLVSGKGRPTTSAGRTSTARPPNEAEAIDGIVALLTDKLTAIQEQLGTMQKKLASNEQRSKDLISVYAARHAAAQSPAPQLDVTSKSIAAFIESREKLDRTGRTDEDNVFNNVIGSSFKEKPDAAFGMVLTPLATCINPGSLYGTSICYNYSAKTGD